MPETQSREGFQPAGSQPQQQNGRPQQPVIDMTPDEAPGIEAQAPPELSERWPITVRLLHRPVRGNNGEELKQLSFREPTGRDINLCGNPCRINLDGDVIIDEKKMSLIMANLAGVLSPNLDRMDPRDWNSCAYRLRNFF